MEHFIVSARKYRPATFKDVVGQQAITNTLENAIANNHLAQALLFTGPRGVGKTTCARILAKKINQEADTSGAEETAVKRDEDYAFNIFELDAASNNSVDDIRNLIDQVRIPPQVGHYKVYIIDEVHMLSQAAFNAFLKTLEEPPKHAIFILATTEKHKIIPTILSRCQIFDFRRITVKDIREHLMDIAQQEGIEAEEEGLHIIAQKADGALRDALSTFDRVVSFSGSSLTRKAVTENLNVLDYETYFEVTDLLLDNNIPQLLLHFNDILSRGFDAHHFVAGLASHFRDLMVCRSPETINLLEVGNQTKKKYHEQAQKTDMTFLLTALEMANDCDLKYRTSRNPRLLVELCLMQLASITFDGEKKKHDRHIIAPEHFAESSPIIPKTAQKQTEKEPINPKPVPTSTPPQPAVVADSETAPEPPKNEENVPEKTENKPKIATIGTSVSGLSLKGMQRKKEILERQNSQQPDENSLPREPFTEIAMQATWKEYVDRLRKKGEKIMASTLETDTPKLNGTVIHLELPNDTMRVELERAQHNLLEYLKRKLSNYDIALAIEVNEQSAKKFAFTPREKYDKMLEANPNLELLLKTFDLDL
ncbi:DNA polymerase III subunit gamma/tau [Flavimarina sp. Hel_I_48]|uniref:DNA polymerase III subunit gamma/tau n=1 Tax=Flavimarina sp. Hel_I_48 TaxID=1392488 RepID=UPI0004DFA818|nr:DNA polymerase III subunit gamma/tau [Flavimarina sp. Hel_I_48]